VTVQIHSCTLLLSNYCSFSSSHILGFFNFNLVTSLVMVWLKFKLRFWSNENLYILKFLIFLTHKFFNYEITDFRVFLRNIFWSWILKFSNSRKVLLTSLNNKLILSILSNIYTDLYFFFGLYHIQLGLSTKCNSLTIEKDKSNLPFSNISNWIIYREEGVWVNHLMVTNAKQEQA